MLRNDDFPRLLSLREAADYLSLSTATVSRLVSRGEISCARSSPRGKRLFSIEELESFICRSTVHAGGGEIK
jgi:excisionase family DNA binding protein